MSLHNTAANNTFYIANVTKDTFELVGSDGTSSGGYTANTGTWVAVPGIIANATGNMVGPIVITSPNHGLRTGQQITIANVGGNSAANGTFFITRIDADKFSLNGTTGNGDYTANTGTWTLAPYPTGALPVGVALADFTLDGILDAVTANQTDNTLSLYTGSASAEVADGTFLAASNLTLGGSGPKPVNVAVGDLNGDGTPDLVVPDFANNAVNVFLGLAQGGYASPVSYSTVSAGRGRQPVSVALGDLTGEGNLDIVVASQQDNVVSILKGNGNGTFGSATTVSVGRTPTDVKLADVNNDGDLDLLVAHNGGGSGGSGNNRAVTVRLGNGNGTFQGATEFATNTRATALAVADFNRDGFLDFAVTDDNTPGRVKIRLSNGKGGFSDGGTFTVGPNPIDIVAADFNGDGYADIATVSRNNTTTDNVSVLLNNLGAGFQPAINTPVPTGTPLQSVVALHVNSDPFLDLVVTSQKFTGTNPPPNPLNNVHVLYGVGDGSFRTNIADYTAAGNGTASPLPSYVGVVSDPFQLLSTFNVGGTTVSVNLVRNGNFETRDLAGEQGNLDGWTTFDLKDATQGSHGAWSIQTGGSSPLSLTTVPPPANGRYQAMLDEQNLRPFFGNNPNTDASYAGSHALYQDIFIPSGASSVKATFRLYLNTAGAWTDTNGDPDLDYRSLDPNQQVRVDIISPSANVLTVGAGLLKNLFITQAGQATTQSVLVSNIDLSAFAGQTIRLRIAATNNQGKLIVGVDDVRVQAVVTDGVAPTLLSLHLRNPTFLSGPSTTEQSTDPTIVGQVSDDASINNIKQVIFDLGNNGFGGADDAVITKFDANGFFSFTPTGLLPGLLTVPVRVVDQAGNKVDASFSFVLQGPSLTNWQAAGPGPIDVSAAGFNYNTISGKITDIAVDGRDPSGNTFYVSSDNGGVWRTVDGGEDWQALTDNVQNAGGQRINVPVGAMAIGTDGTVYAATGVDDNSLASRSGVGILKSTNDGRTWSVLGGATFAGARVSKMVVDPRNSNVVYVAITSWDDPSKQPGIFKTSDGGTTWTNVLIQKNMFNPGGTALMASDLLASVTDMIIDPFAPGRLIIGLGNIGQTSSTLATAGVWLTTNGGGRWDKIIGGDNKLIPNNTIPQGTTVGRITLAQGSGRVGDERFVYVLMAKAVSNVDTFNQGGFLGLFKNSDNLLNFTKVMLKQELGQRFAEDFEDLDLLGSEGATVGAMAVDPSNPNVVYVGGSGRFDVGATNHALLRIDTGNMRDATYSVGGKIPNDGDDIDKAAAANGGAYPSSSGGTGVTYTGEGVYWYDIIQAKASGSSNRNFLPNSIERIVLDSQGRLLFGTQNGIYRGTALGFGYDFRSGGDGIIRGFGSNFRFNPPGMTITELNGNLQITDLTSVAIDPYDSNRLYIAGLEVGTALTAGGVFSWVTNGLTGPTVPNVGNLGIPNAFQVLAAKGASDAANNAVTTEYRIWQARGSASLIPEVSADSGETFSTTNSAGISVNDTAGIAPVLAINPTKLKVNDSLFDELLFGTNTLYHSPTGGNVWDKIATLSSGFYSALAFSPTPGVYLAGTTDGKVFKIVNNISTNITNNLPALLGPAVFYRVNGITVDPTNPNTIYLMLGVPTGKAGVYRSTNGGSTWAAVTGTVAGKQLPLVSAYAMVIDPRASTGAPNGRIYVGTDRGAFTSTDGGTTWLPLGQGLPAAPVVSLQFNQQLETLAAATQGRGVFTLSTARLGPAVVSVTPASPIDAGALSEINVTFNEPVDPRTFTADSNNVARTVLSLIALTSTDFAVTRIKQLVQQFLHRPASQNDPLINTGLSYFFVLNPDGSIQQTTDAALPGVTINRTRDDGEIQFTAFLTASDEYFTNVAGNTNAKWIEQLWQDLLGRTAVGDSQASIFLNQLNANPPQTTRLAIAQQLTGAAPTTGKLNPLSVEYDTNLVASLFNKFLARNYPAAGASSDEIKVQVATLQRRGLLRNVIARIISTTEAYQKMGNDYALPAGVHATALTFGNFSGTTVNVGGTDPNALVLPVLDLAVAGSDGNVYIFQGQVGGGFAQNPTKVLALPSTNAAPSALVAADLDQDGKMDLVVANSGPVGTGKSVSVFLNNRTAVGMLSFAARADYDGGNNPVGLVAGNIDNDPSGNLDLVTANRTANGAGNFTVTVLLGNGAGAFGSPTAIKVGDNIPNAAELTNPTGIALGNLTGDGKPDLVVSGDNGLVVLTNTTPAPGLPTFSALSARLTNTATTSVAVGNLDSDTDNDIAATSDAAAGEVLLFQNGGSGSFSLAGTVSVGANPRSLQLADMNGDGRLDVTVANDIQGGGVTIAFNTTVAAASPPDTITFGTPITYPLTGNRPSALAIGDTNQDGIPDVAVGYEGSELVSLLIGQQEGILKAATDRNWLDWIFRSQAGRPFTVAERDSFVLVLAANALVYLNGSDGVAAPLSVTPVDSSNLTFKLTFGPRLLDGTYRFFLGPNGQGINLKDFIDLDGTYTNTGNPMNQNRNAINGERPQGTFPFDASPGDRFAMRMAVNTNDDGRFVTALYQDFQGTSPNGRDPDNDGFISLIGVVEPARLASLNSVATTLVGSQEEVDNLINGVYQRYLRQGPTMTQLTTARNQILAGQLTVRTLVAQVLASDDYFNKASLGNSDNTTWITHVYADLLPGVTAPTFPVGQTRLQITTSLVFSDPVLRRTVTEYFLQLLGRTPFRNPDPALDETVSLVSLLKQSAAPGQLSPDQRLIISLVSLPEYLRIHGNSNIEWLKSIYLGVLGRSMIDTSTTTGTEFNGVLNTLLTNYTSARQSALTTIISNQEFRNRSYTDYFAQFLSTPGSVRVPSAAELAAEETVYQNNGKRLEAAVAAILATNEYFPLSGPGSANSTWLSKIYADLLNQSTAGNSTAQDQLNFLNSQPASQLAAARMTVALQVLNTTDYRQLLITKFYNLYLGRTPSTSEVSTLVDLMNTQNFTQEMVLIRLLRDPEYFRHVT